MTGPRQPRSWSRSPLLLLAAGQKGLEVVAVGALWKDEEEKPCPGAWASFPRCPSLRVCRHTCVVAVLFCVTNCSGSTRWQAAESRAPAGGLAGGGGRQGASFKGGKDERWHAGRRLST